MINCFAFFWKIIFKKKSIQNEAIPAASAERVHYLIYRLSLAEGYLKIEELADELFISKSTIQNNLRDVKKVMETHGIQFGAKPNYGFKLKGKEVKLRYCIAEYIFNRTDRDFSFNTMGSLILLKTK
ncbi:helix-turn-helix domain-containing protein [Jeotgalibacillus soli]|uniref:PTS fructose transporter subunit IIA n=1 Tax=Jeotgalibacillus soli TaxID=889306 RepID=A0A0C2S7R4_9BACL|nr:helix-turn-helix domain-containing protein [Jeotgalibacillus soli]KIL50029.1 PTS fructose transporter subunit IIA [Jeotgalibacillus soli]